MNFRYQKLIGPGQDTKKSVVARPYIPVRLSGPTGSSRPFYALLDSGADKTIAPVDFAEVIGIQDLKKGYYESSIGIGEQKIDVFYHKASIEVLGDPRKVVLEVGFSEKIFFPILGRTFFYHFKSINFREKKEDVEFFI